MTTSAEQINELIGGYTDLKTYFEGQRDSWAADIAAKEAEVDAFVAAKGAEVDGFIAGGDDKYRWLNLARTVITTPGDAEHYYPVVFDTGRGATINEVMISRSVNAQQDLYGSFNGGIFFHANITHTSWGSLPGTVELHAYRETSYSPDVPATTQFVAKIATTWSGDAAPLVRPCLWLRGNTEFSVGHALGDLKMCAGDGIIDGNDYGVLTAAHSPLLSFTTNP